MEYGFALKEAQIKKISFPIGKIQVELKDGRIFLAPLSKFPELKKMKPAERKKIGISQTGVSFDFDNSENVYSLFDIIGLNENGKKFVL